MNRHTRLLIALHVTFDALIGMAAFALAYVIRFETGFLPIPKGQPPFEQYIAIMPFIGFIVPIAYQLQGTYRLSRSRTPVDDFFAVFVGTLLAVVLGLLSTLYMQVYFASPAARAAGSYEVSRLVWFHFAALNIIRTYGGRAVVRAYFERRYKSGVGLQRVLLAGTGDLAKHVVDRLIQHVELGYKIVGFIDNAKGDGHLGHRGLPLLGTLADAEEIIRTENIDQLYVALPLDQHVNMLGLVEVANKECIDVKVIPDFLQFVTLRAKLEELDGIPLINVNDVPLHGFNSVIKRTLDIACATGALSLLFLPMLVIACVIKSTSKGPILYKQQRMGLDGRPFELLKFRSMHQDAESNTGPVWATENDPRRTRFGGLLRRLSLDELPQFWNVLMGDMSLVGPRPERPFFVEQFKERVPQYMLRHKVKAGITGWAQVNGWRGNTSIEKRIEYDLYYIENWSVGFDIKIMWLTVVYLSFHRHAY